MTGEKSIVFQPKKPADSLNSMNQYNITTHVNEKGYSPMIKNDLNFV